MRGQAQSDIGNLTKVQQGKHKVKAQCGGAIISIYNKPSLCSGSCDDFNANKQL